MGRAVRLDVGAVDRRAPGHRARRSKRLDQTAPEPFARPTVEAVVDRGRRAVVRWTIAPAAPHLEDMDDTRDHPAVIDPSSAALVSR